jgi:alpha-glucosidase
MPGGAKCGRQAAMARDDWWRGAVLYQIYPRSFLDTDGDGIGDLKGIASKLDYVKSLGVDGVWLSPFFRSPMRDFGYDVSDYCDVDPMFGALKDFDALLKGAHDRDLKVIIDQVWSHTSSDHEWFKASRQDRANPHADWYVWADPKPDGSPPNNWQAWFGGPAWTWEPRRRQYYLHNFLPTQPDLNFRSSGVRSAILAIARFWMDRGVDGFRLDVANYYAHDAQLRDNPPSHKPNPALPRDMQIHQFNSNQPESLEFVARLRNLLDSYKARMTVGELAPGSYALMAEYTRGRERLHTAYAFDFLGAWPGVEKMADILTQWREGPDDGWPSWAFSNHDVQRVATRWGEAIGAPPGRAALLFLSLLLCLRGTIFLYQGEELGLPEADVPFDKLQDPWGIAGWPAAKGRDGCRTPMPWKDAPAGGFTRAKEGWLPVDVRQRQISVERQEALSQSTLHSARQLIGVRQASAALREGGFEVVRVGLSWMLPVGEEPPAEAPARKRRLRAIDADDDDRREALQEAIEASQADIPKGQDPSGLLAFERVAGAERLLCVFNFANATATHQVGAGKASVLWAGDAVLAGGNLVLEPFGSAILKLA